jgi:hypothetical protein
MHYGIPLLPLTVTWMACNEDGLLKAETCVGAIDLLMRI